MKRLIWRSRKSPSTETRRFKASIPLIAAFLTIITIASCRIHRSASEGEDDGSSAWIMDPFGALISKESDPPPASVPLHLDTQDGPRLGTINPRACHGPGKNGQRTWIRIPLDTSVGTTTLELSWAPGPVQRVNVAVDDQTISLAAPGSQELTDLGLCRSREWRPEAGHPLVAESKAEDLFRDWVEALAPECSMTLTSTGWACELPLGATANAAADLRSLRRTMIRRWDRQPYLISRRLAVTLTLAEAAASPHAEKELDALCRILEHSKLLELPAAMGSNRWREALCKGDLEPRITAARVGLSAAMAELDRLAELFEDNSRLGFLTMKIPYDTVPHKRLWVELTPAPDLSGSLARELSVTNAEDDEKTHATAGPCWHPLFGEDPELMFLASHMGMAGEPTSARCKRSFHTEEDGPPLEDLSRYLAESLTSETAFVVSNGRSKLLRLPEGEYRYTLETLPDNPSTWNDASENGPSSSGEFAWQGHRPRAVIRAW